MSELITLTPDQNRARDLLHRWWSQDPKSRPFRLDGYAGTGKTTVVLHLLVSLGLQPEEVSLLAPTGKAARVLARRTGWEARTIHRALYQPLESGKLMKLREDLTSCVDPKERDELRQHLARLEKKEGVNFSFRGGLVDQKLVVVDEISMVSDRLASDLSSLGVPLLLLGDPGQLPPVRAAAGFSEVQADITLTEIVRQDEGSSILRAADLVRRKQRLPETCDWGAFKRVLPKVLSDAEYADYDVVLCGTHRVRRAFNRRLRRQVLGLEEEHWTPQPKDRLICRRNDYRRLLMNGQLLEATSRAVEVDDLCAQLDLRDDEGQLRCELVNTLRFREHYDRRTAVHTVDGALEVDFAYALTVHSAQGSEWDRVVVLNDWPGSDHARWLYTALTRGAQEVVLVG